MAHCCKYLGYLKTVNMDYIATWDERDRRQNMLVLRFKDGKNPGTMSRRDDFKLAARSFAVASHQKVNNIFTRWTISTVTIKRINSIRPEMAKSKLSRDIWIAGVILVIFGNLMETPRMAVVGVSKMTRTTPGRMAPPTLVGKVMATDSFKPCRFFLTDFAYRHPRLSCTRRRDEDRTPRRTSRRWRELAPPNWRVRAELRNRPPQEEREEHKATHVLIRDWRTRCVMGRGRTPHHVTKQNSEGRLRRLTIALDCYLMSVKYVVNAQTIWKELLTCIAVKRQTSRNHEQCCVEWRWGKTMDSWERSEIRRLALDIVRSRWRATQSQHSLRLESEWRIQWNEKCHPTGSTRTQWGCCVTSSEISHATREAARKKNSERLANPAVVGETWRHNTSPYAPQTHIVLVF